MVSKIEWQPVGMTGERGQMNGKDLFHLTYPDEWSSDFVLTSPLIFSGDRMGWLGSVGLSGPPPGTRHSGRPTRAEVRAAFEADKAAFEQGRGLAREFAERVLIDFANSVLRD